MTSWSEYVKAMPDDQCRGLATQRGVRPEFYLWLKKENHLGSIEGQPAFPIHGGNGDVVGCHYRAPAGWGVAWFVSDPNVQHMTPLVIGKPDKAQWAFVFESQWDAWAVMSVYQVDLNPGWLEPGCIVITRGAGNGKSLQGVLPPTCCAYAWKQNDPVKNGTPPPADKWLADVARYAGCQVYWVKTPLPHKDANEWLQAGATGDDFTNAVQAAVAVPPPAPEEKPGRMPVPDWVELGLVADEEAESRKPFPTEHLPEPYKNMIVEVSRINGLPESVAGVVALATMSASIGSGLAACLYRDKMTRANLYLLTALASGEGKSVTFEPMFKPFAEFQAELLDRWRHEVWMDAKAKLEVLQQQRERLRKQAKQAKSPEDLAGIQSQLASIEGELHQVQSKLVEPTLKVEDATTEKLTEVLLFNSETAALVSSDAGDVVANIAGRYRKGEAVDDNLYVKAYSGDSVTVHRLNRPAISLRAPCLTILLMVQPDKLSFMLSKSRLIEGGLMPRFLMTWPPCAPAKVSAEPVQIPANVSGAYSNAITGLLNTFRLAKDRLRAEASRDARLVIADYANQVAERRGGDLKDIASFAARWAEQACRLAVVLHAAQHVGNAGQIEIPADTARAAVAIADWFAAEQLAILRTKRSQSQEQTLTALWRLLQTSPQGITARDVLRKRIVEDAEQAKRLLTCMAEKELLTQEEKTTGGHPKTVFQIKR